LISKIFKAGSFITTDPKLREIKKMNFKQIFTLFTEEELLQSMIDGLRIIDTCQHRVIVLRWPLIRIRQRQDWHGHHDRIKVSYG
jgi:hypothetical protein